MKVNIRKMNTADVDQVMEIELKSFTMPWSRETYISDLNSGFGEYIVANIEGNIVGYAGMFIVLDEAHIGTIATAENFRGQGIGKALMDELFQMALDAGAASIFLEVRVSNLPAISLYEKSGFQKIAIRKDYYTDNMEDAIIMKKFF